MIFLSTNLLDEIDINVNILDKKKEAADETVTNTIFNFEPENQPHFTVFETSTGPIVYDIQEPSITGDSVKEIANLFWWLKWLLLHCLFM